MSSVQFLDYYITQRSNSSAVQIHEKIRENLEEFLDQLMFFSALGCASLSSCVRDDGVRQESLLSAQICPTGLLEDCFRTTQ